MSRQVAYCLRADIPSNKNSKTKTRAPSSKVGLHGNSEAKDERNGCTHQRECRRSLGVNAPRPWTRRWRAVAVSFGTSRLTVKATETEECARAFGRQLHFSYCRYLAPLNRLRPAHHSAQTQHRTATHASCTQHHHCYPRHKHKAPPPLPSPSSSALPSCVATRWQRDRFSPNLL